MIDSILSLLYRNKDKKTKIKEKLDKTVKTRVYPIVYTMLITPDLLKMLMEKSRV